MCISTVKTLLRSYTALILLRLRCFQSLNEILGVHTSYIIKMTYQWSFFSILSPNSEGSQPTPSFISLHGEKKAKEQGKNLTYLLCMTQISIIAICVQVLCLVVDDVRWHVCWCDMTLGEEQPSTDGTCQWVNPPLAISVLKTPAILWLYE